METHRVAQEAVYLFPASRVIDDRYLGKALPVIHEQLAKAAVRLAGVLNRAMGTSGNRGRAVPSTTLCRRRSSTGKRRRSPKRNRWSPPMNPEKATEGFCDGFT